MLQEIPTYTYEQGKEHGSKVDWWFFIIKEGKRWPVFTLIKTGLSIPRESHNGVIQQCKYGSSRLTKPTIHLIRTRLLSSNVVDSFFRNRRPGCTYYALMVFRDEHIPPAAAAADVRTLKGQHCRAITFLHDSQDWVNRNRLNTGYSAIKNSGENQASK